MINDGYNLIAAVGGFTFVYRPLIRFQRETLKEALSSGSKEMQEFIIDNVFSQQISIGYERVSDLTEPQSDTLWDYVTAVGKSEEERRDEKNLAKGTRLYSQFPHLAHVSCDQCKEWWYDPISGRTAEREQKPLRRNPGSTLLCQTAMGCPKGTPEDPVGFSSKNAKAFRHYQECAAVSQWPDDAIARRNAAVISNAMKGS